jgi:hypothetical protein
LVKPEAAAVKDTAVPLFTDEPGLNDWIDKDAGDVTVIASVVVAASPEESFTAMVIVCEPTSPEVGVQLKFPDELIFEPDTLLPPRESVMVYVGLVKPDAETVKKTGVPTETLLPGDRDWTEAEPAAFAKQSGASKRMGTRNSLII